MGENSYERFLIKSSKLSSGKDKSLIDLLNLVRRLVMDCLLRFNIRAIPTGEMPILDSQHSCLTFIVMKGNTWSKCWLNVGYMKLIASFMFSQSPFWISIVSF